MRVEGEWHRFDDGVTRPVMTGQIAGSPEKNNVDVRFLVDCGADRTVLSAAVLTRLALPRQAAPPDTHLQGVSGQCDYVTVESVIILTRDDGGMAQVRGEFLGLTDPSATDLCILGRDVTDNFDLILSRRRKEVLLLAPTHEYQIIRR